MGILPTVFQVLINGRVACPNRMWSCDVLDDQYFGWSCAIFPGSPAIKSCDTLGTVRSRDGSCDGSCDRFPWSRVLEITWLELGLGAVIIRLVLVECVLGLFGNSFLVGASFARDMNHQLKLHMTLFKTSSTSHIASWMLRGAMAQAQLMLMLQ